MKTERYLRVRISIVAMGAGVALLTSSFPTARAQTTTPTAASTPAAYQAKPVPQVPATGSAAGGLLGQLSRELGNILRATKDGVVTIRGLRRVPVTSAAVPNLNPGIPPAPPQVGPAPWIAMPVVGSGFFVQDDIVLTTAEVATDIINPVIILPDRRFLRVVAKTLDDKNNIAIFRVVQIEKPKPEDVAHHPLHLGDSDLVQPGEIAVTMGNQAGFLGTSALAFIAQTNRRARSGAHVYTGLLQFQGAVEPGSSGSPLIGPTGEVIGMVMAAPDPSQGGFQNGFRNNLGGNFGNNFGGGGGFGGRNVPQHHNSSNGTNSPGGPNAAPDKSAPSSSRKTHGPNNVPAERHDRVIPDRPAGAAPPAGIGQPQPAAPAPQGVANLFGGISGIGFALPINMVQNRLIDMVQTLTPVPAPGWMGVVLSRRSGLDSNTNPNAKPPVAPAPPIGIQVTNLRVGSPADLAGLNVGDIIVQIDGQPVSSEADFQIVLGLATEGQTIRVQVKRDNGLRNFNVKMRDMPERSVIDQMGLKVPPRDL